MEMSLKDYDIWKNKKHSLFSLKKKKERQKQSHFDEGEEWEEGDFYF